jgi:hypothetical protein
MGSIFLDWSTKSSAKLVQPERWRIRPVKRPPRVECGEKVRSEAPQMQIAV